MDYANIDHNPMGGIDVGGYVNGDKQMNFDTVLDKDLDTGKIYYGAGLMSQKLGRLLDTK
nr:DUF1310 family protein [Fructilactobacillus florum]